MPTLNFSHYAFVQVGATICSVGSTEAEARKNAMVYLRDNTDDDSPGMHTVEAPFCDTLIGEYRIEGALCVVRCTQVLHDEVQANGSCEWVDGSEQQGICLPSELP